MKQDLVFLFKTIFVYGILAMSFSFIGIFLPEKSYQPNPLESYSLEEVLGHITWGLIAGAASLSLRYFFLSGAVAIVIDSDHLIGLLPIEAMSRMGHSITFGIISLVIIMVLFGKRNYLLGATVFSGMLAHLSFDTFFDNEGKFPLLIPFYTHQIVFQHAHWIFLEIVAITLIGFCALLTKRQIIKNSKTNHN
jgi:hypothetical protein